MPAAGLVHRGGARARRPPRCARRSPSRRPPGRCDGRDRIGAPAGAARARASRPSVRRPPREHPDAAVEGAARRGRRDGGRCARPARARGPDRRGTRPGGDAASGRAGRAGRRMPGGRRRDARRCCVRSSTRPSRAAVDGRARLPRRSRRWVRPARSERTSRPIRAGGVARGSSPTWRARPCCGTPSSVMIRSRSALLVATVLLGARVGPPC